MTSQAGWLQQQNSQLWSCRVQGQDAGGFVSRESPLPGLYTSSLCAPMAFPQYVHRERERALSSSNTGPNPIRLGLRPYDHNDPSLPPFPRGTHTEGWNPNVWIWGRRSSVHSTEEGPTKVRLRPWLGVIVERSNGSMEAWEGQGAIVWHRQPLADRNDCWLDLTWARRVNMGGPLG